MNSNVQTPLEDFMDVFGPVDATFLLHNNIIKDIVALKRDYFWPYFLDRDSNGYTVMHYCVAQLIACHKWKPKDATSIFMYRYRSDELAEKWKNENRWVRAVNHFLSALNNGFSINAPRIQRGGLIDESPLMFAIEKHAPIDVLKLLIKYGAYIDQELVSGTSVLSICCANNYYEAAKLLLEMGADPNVIDDGLANPLSYVLDEYWEEKPDFEKMDKFINLFLDYGSDPDNVNEFFCEYLKNKKEWYDNLEPGKIRDHKLKTFELFEKYRKHN